MKNWTDCTKKERIARWENVERVLSEMTPHERRKHWNMGTWGKKTDCGTIACAAGHCGLDPWFRRREFKLNFRMTPGGCEAENCELCKDEPLAPVAIISDVHDFFGDNNIFFNGAHRPVSKVIKEVRAYIKELKAVTP